MALSIRSIGRRSLQQASSSLSSIVNQRFLSTSQTTKSAPKVLVLGSGMVVPPVVDYLGSQSALKPSVTIGGIDFERSEELAKNHQRVNPLQIDVTDIDALDQAVKDHDLVISLVPWPLHPKIAENCIKNKVNMVTTSYVSDAMQDLHQSARDAGITILNECGLDPGIDHLGAMKIIDDVKERGGKITSFISFCGGLPAAEDSFVPLQYKFSWSPRGVFAAGLSQATYKLNGEVKTTDMGHLFNYASPMDIFPSLNLEGYPNRNSLVYEDAYGIQGCDTILRGTLRYKGFCTVMRAMQMLGLFSEAADPSLNIDAPTITWVEKMAQLLQSDAPRTQLGDTLQANGFTAEEIQLISRSMDRLGLFSSQQVNASGTVIDALCEKLLVDLKYNENERDMVLLSHEFIAEWKDGSKSQINSTLVKTGIPNGETAMALTVGLPCALGAELVLNNSSAALGVVRPLAKDFYLPLLQDLERHGIVMKEEEIKLD